MISSNFLKFSHRNLLSQKFCKNPKFCWEFLHNIPTHLSQCQLFFYFRIKIMQRTCQYIFITRVSRRNGVLFDIAFILYFSVFLFSLHILWKFLTLCLFSRNAKKVIQLVETYHMLQISVISSSKVIWWIAVSLHLLNNFCNYFQRASMHFVD